MEAWAALLLLNYSLDWFIDLLPTSLKENLTPCVTLLSKEYTV